MSTIGIAMLTPLLVLALGLFAAAAVGFLRWYMR